MQLALYTPGLGYYSAGARKFGAAAISSLRPKWRRSSAAALPCNARRCCATSGSSDARILELGAGSGVMAAELLAELERQGALPAQYLILDLSADLRERQRATLEQAVPHLLDARALARRAARRPRSPG